MRKFEGWIGVDLDRTLAYYEAGDFERYGPYHIGKPIRKMVDRIIQHIVDGEDVRIFTARLADQDLGQDVQKIKWSIETWCEEHLGKVLPITNVKDHYMDVLYDDKAIQIVANTGNRVDGEN